MNTSTGRRLLAPLLMAVAIACDGDGPTQPQTGSVVVWVQLSGGDLDVDGFQFVIGADRQLVFGNASGRLDKVATGTYAVSLEKVAENCTVNGANPQSVTVIRGDTARVTFDVVCVATGIVVTTRTTGVDTPESYGLIVNGTDSARIEPNYSLNVGRLTPGTYTVALASPGDNCSVTGASQVTVQVAARTVTPVLFEVTCTAAVRRELIAFASDSTDGPFFSHQWIGVVDLDGTGAVKLVPGHSPTWSPDGTRILFSTAVCDEYNYYYRDLCPGGLMTIDPETRRITTLSGGRGGFNAAWSPTEDVIVFTRCCELGAVDARLYRLALDGSDPVELDAPAVGMNEPAWSPDGQRIAFACRVDPSQWDLCVMDADGGRFRRLTNTSPNERAPSWSPDGKRIALTQTDVRVHVAVMDLDDLSVTVLADGGDPAWSRDGTTLVFSHLDGLYTINPDGSSHARLTTARLYAPAWRP